MQSHINTTAQLDLVRSDAAARQARAATYRFVHAQRPSHSPARRARRTISVAVAAVLLTFGIAGAASATVTDTGAHCSGYEVGLPDGCWNPTAETLVPSNVR